MIAVGIEAHVAMATNMMALIFMSAGGALPFARKGVIERRLLPLAITLTVAAPASVPCSCSAFRPEHSN